MHIILVKIKMKMQAKIFKRSHSIKVYEKIELPVVYGLKCFVLEFVVVDGKNIVLGLNAAQEMNIIKLVESINQSNFNISCLKIIKMFLKELVNCHVCIKLA
ncbi:hypothetical protein LAZ67_2005922 [Cordylochernes scorpioides]|uniref:Uncharacterized protein n=1 Tax=Cordylochernes scorpioides TaxID=51811 RepID=A0ABY6K866_9ARAC|nr:hypothetical protein LAZ67_2005922 [Cordylochernes scorpioides]